MILIEIKKILSYIMYNIVKYFPKSNANISFFSKRLRFKAAKGFIKYIGENVNIERRATFSSSLQIGDNSGVGINCVLQGDIRIGKDVMMGPNVWIYTRNHRHDRLDIPMIDQGFEEERPVIIEDDVWIGSRVTILPGVKISRGTIIGTGSVVTKDIPEYSVVVGNPAKVIKNRKSIVK